jgi:hypothetical protein
MLGIFRHLAVPQGDQLTNHFVKQLVRFVAGRVRRQQQRFPIRRHEDAFRRDMIPILAVAVDKIAAAQIAEGKRSDRAEILLTKQ